MNISFSHHAASYPVQRYGSGNPLNFHLDNVYCTGNESKLSDCYHLGVGVHNCFKGYEEAGVVCNSKLLTVHIYTFTKMIYICSHNSLTRACDI